ncbi:HlyD family type I secretion periplasmic adaptor subunit [Candidatus Methylomicrobium oryzae]|jgi:epimerase transport system membrane fusion protein|uniref:HlyD family type I secretion periplasmic adaptor subunit n=1 Tax=Candidatus Methylomicrobium oryzae TaxID=2802053 RepID=UPI0019224F7F|nr:HlyD family type I secretion periplasmic adaptor subunit [Methylomicrobium sp. RS1]MBL1264580.1 HlyD family type I secretion periplasmic adaptor subunit [Methylomicrobium sp. RS1]
MTQNTRGNISSPDLHTNDWSIRLIGTVIVILTFGIFGGWAFLAPIDSSALAPGVVVVKSHRKTVQHLDGGIVARILAKDGDLVNEGDPLLILDDTQLKAQMEIARSQFISLAAQAARLRAEKDQLNQIAFPDELKDDSDQKVTEAKKAEINVFKSRKTTHDGEVAVLRERISQISSKIKGLQAQVESKKVLVDSFGEEIHDLKELLAEGYADKLRLRDMERSHAMQNGEIAQLNAEIATNQMLISETRLQIMQIQKKFQEEVASKLSEVQAQLNDVNERLSATKDKLDRIIIKAPVSGMVMGLSVHTQNGVISPGHAILDIVPRDAELIIEAQVSPNDIDRVSVGLHAEVRFSAFKQSQTPKMDGTVIQLSADRFVDDQSGTPYYQARVELTPESRKKLGKLQLVPGMPAEVLINTGERTLFEYLAQPATNAFARAFIED